MSLTRRWRTTSWEVSRRSARRRCRRGSPGPRAARRGAAGRSTWVTSPVTTILEPKPSRVRNIFICSGEVFCASSRMMNASLRVPAAHVRQRRDLDGPGGHQPRDRLRVDHVVQRVVERPQVRVDLLEQRAGQEPEPLPRLDRRAGQDDPVDLLGLQRLHRLGHREVGLAGARRADPEDDGVLVDRVDVALLVQRLRPDRAAAVGQDVERQHLGRPLAGLGAQHR